MNVGRDGKRRESRKERGGKERKKARGQAIAKQKKSR